jgi:phosphoglycolate phosphatase-like HAD superfamily hydrolase
LSGNNSRYILTKESFDAVIFDLDGVITKTAKVHAAAWKELFDHFLHNLVKRSGKAKNSNLLISTWIIGNMWTASRATTG